jgi:hypothetical protein
MTNYLAKYKKKNKMKIKVKTEIEQDIKTLHISAGVRYWEDATVNGVEDTEGTLIPCRNGENWQPIIDVDSGTIIDWPAGTEASIHYKVCDAGTYKLCNEAGDVVLEHDGYVPKIACPQPNGYGDYIIMYVGSDGKIANWEFSLYGFNDAE